jgi:putative FmdB family regulatory protein
MPIYEYKCKKCKKEFECLVVGSAKDIECPTCSGRNVERLMSACSFKSSGKFTAPGSSSACSTCGGGSCSTCH